MPFLLRRRVAGLRSRYSIAEAARMDKLLRIAEVQELTGPSRWTIYKKVAEGVLPPPVRLSSRCVRAKEAEQVDCQ